MRLFFLIIFLLFVALLNAQNVGINTDGSAPDASAALDIQSTGKGLLIPRMTTAQRTTIVSPATGLLVFDTNTGSFWYYSGIAWMNLSGGWSLSGNNNTNAATQFIGTTDNVPLIVKVNNERSGYLSSSNTSWGSRALKNNTTGYSNTAIGVESLFSNTAGIDNVAIGSWSLYSNTNGNYNVAHGVNALYTNTTGEQNVAIGAGSLAYNETGSYNVAGGFSALSYNTTGSNNVASGTYALDNNTTGSYNTAIGYNANVGAGNLTNATAIGYAAVVNASNKVRIGNSAVTVIEGQVAFTRPSDGRFKFNVREDVKGLDFI
ncbi:MAG TPA: hypothetical protein VFS31_00560, partial [Chitinophagaceae bacterium]|nr:hypothetical protein [Chitinophagaceae bacterium]